MRFHELFVCISYHLCYLSLPLNAICRNRMYPLFGNTACCGLVGDTIHKSVSAYKILGYCRENAPCFSASIGYATLQ